MSLEQITITVDEQWVLNLVEKLRKYEMFKDQRQKIMEAIKTAESDDQAAKRGAVTQNMVELWCVGHGVKMVQREDLIKPFEGTECPNKSLASCPGIWIKPFEGITADDGVALCTCTSHTQCSKCWRCIDGAGWVLPNSKAICTDCRAKSGKVGLSAVPKQFPLANVNRPNLGTVRKVTIPNDEDVAPAKVKTVAKAKAKTVAKAKAKTATKTVTPKKTSAAKAATIAPVKKTSPKKVAPKSAAKAVAKPAPKSELFTFAAKRRAELKVSNPDLGHHDLTKLISEEWKIKKSNV